MNLLGKKFRGFLGVHSTTKKNVIPLWNSLSRSLYIYPRRFLYNYLMDSLSTSLSRPLGSNTRNIKDELSVLASGTSR